MATVDASIPLSAQPVNIDMGGAYDRANALMRLQQTGRQMQAQNALRQILSQPGAVDPATGAPSPNALRQLYQVDPGYAMGISKNALALKGQALNQQRTQLQLSEDQDAALAKARQAAIAASDDTLKRTGSPQAARDAAQRVWTEETTPFRTSDAWSPEITSRIPTAYEEERFRNREAQWAANKAMVEAKEKRADKELAFEGQRVGMERERIDLEKKRLTGLSLTPEAKDEAAKRYLTSGTLPAGSSTAQDSEIINRASQLRKEGYTGPKDLGNPVEVEIDKPGGGTERVLAQQDKTTGQWYSADEKRRPISGENMRVVKEGGASGREGTLIQRQLIDAADATSEIGNIAELPATTSTGFFGGRRQGPSLRDAAKEVLTNKVTSQEVQDYNTSAVGLGRALAGLETGGLQVNQGLMQQFEGLQLKEGDTQLTKMRKLATMRQNADNALKAAITNPRMGKEQVELAKQLRADLEKAVPWTPHDVTMLEKSDNPKATLSDFAKDKGLAPGKLPKVGSTADYNKLKSGEYYLDPDGVERVKR